MAEKLEMKSSNVVQDHIKEIQKLFPNAVTEISAVGGTTLAIDFDVLKQELSSELISDKQERYQMTWPDKKKSILLSNSRISATLRPVKEKSVDFENTKNIYIEGDNLDVLKLLRETYLNKIKLIYIDPPYNTGNDFVYEDDFSLDSEDYLNNSAQYDELGNRLFINNETNGRFHTDWLNMLYPRLKVAKDFLTEDGVIFISIDDNEVENLKKICNEIYGEKNIVACVVWERAFSPVNLKKHFSESHDFILIYAKSIDALNCNGLKRSLITDSRYSNPDNDARGVWTSSDMTVGPVVYDKLYEIISPSGKVLKPASGRCWLYTKEKFEEMKADNRIWFGVDGNNMPRVKKFLSEVKQGVTPTTIWKFTDVGHSQEASQYLKKLFGGKSYFDYPKPVKLIKQLISLYDSDECYIMDFFSGSGTTAESIFELNKDDNKNRKFILVQLPELNSNKTDAFKDGYKTICDIGEERIRRAGNKILAEYKKSNESEGLFASVTCECKLDIGFRVLKLDSSNMNDVYYNANSTTQSLFDSTVDNVKPDRTPLDLLFQVMLELGIELSAKIEEKEIFGKKYFVVNENDIVACFDSNVKNDVIKELAQIKPIYAVFRDSVFENDSANINCEQLFKSISPSTTIKVL